MRLFVSIGLFLLIIISPSVPLQAAEPASNRSCPVGVSYAYLGAVGASKSSGRYIVGLMGTPGSSYSIRFVIAGSSAKVSRTVLFPEVDFYNGPFATLTFVWPASDAANISSSEITDLKAQGPVTCSISHAIVDPGSPRVAPSFDDSGVKEYPEMVGTSLTPGYYGAAAPGFVRKVTPEYPQTAKDKNVQGTVVVLITIGPNAVLQDSSILASSGSDALDKAALAAARQSTYKAPEADNKSSTHRYVVTYTFSLYSIDYQK